MVSNVSELRTRQTELVQELAVESSTAKLIELSNELEDVSRQLESAIRMKSGSEEA
jgi:hypothetical protein